MNTIITFNTLSINIVFFNQDSDIPMTEKFWSKLLMYCSRDARFFWALRILACDVEKLSSLTLLVCDLNRTPNCYGKTWRLLCPFFRNLHLRENLARDCFTSTASTVTNSVQNISLPVYVIVTNTRLQPLTTTFYNSMLVSFSLLKI